MQGDPDLDAVLAALVALAEESPRAEICGLVLAPTGGGLPELVPLRNASPDPARAFAAEAGELLAALRGAERRGRAVAAIFHSHLAGGAGLSPSDVAQLTEDGGPLWPGAELWVVGLEGGRVSEVRAHAFGGGRFVERTLRRGPFTKR